MTAPSTSLEQKHALIEISSKIYPAIDQIVDNESRASRMLRMGIQVVAMTVGVDQDYRTEAGTAWMAVQHQELSRGGIALQDYDQFPSYQQIARKLPTAPIVEHWNEPLDELAQKYAEVRRATIAADGSYETDATHAVHLSSLAVAYAAEYHPELHLPTVALYALIHDIVEAYAGDTPSLGLSEIERHEKAHREKLALERIECEFGEAFPEFVQACKDYEGLADDEAKFIKTFDKLDPSFTHIANECLALRRDRGVSSADEYRALMQHTTRSITYADQFLELLQVRQLLIDDAALSTTWGEKIPA